MASDLPRLYSGWSTKSVLFWKCIFDTRSCHFISLSIYFRLAGWPVTMCQITELWCMNLHFSTQQPLGLNMIVKIAGFSKYSSINILTFRLIGYLFSCLAHVINLVTQAILSTYSISRHYNPHDPNAHIPSNLSLGNRDVLGHGAGNICEGKVFRHCCCVTL
jgi:hypothetical protein